MAVAKTLLILSLIFFMLKIIIHRYIKTRQKQYTAIDFITGYDSIDTLFPILRRSKDRKDGILIRIANIFICLCYILFIAGMAVVLINQL
jgi:hypothetical protein